MTSGPTWTALLRALLEGKDLSAAQTRWAMGEVMGGEAPPVALAGFLVALRAKGETVEELTGLADEMVAHALPVTFEGRALDIVGTGGDMLHTVNISTMAAVVAAAAGVTVVKHGNRASSSSTGTADVLEALGLVLDQTPERAAAIAREVGITFCFAQVFHPSMRHAGAVRRGLGVPTAFNFLGPLTNPARPAAAVIGATDPRIAELMAGVLAGRGTSALVMRGHQGLDELAATGPADVWWVEGGRVERRAFDAATEVGLPGITVDQLRGGMPAQNAAVVRAVLAGERGAVRDTVLLNAAAALAVDGTTPGTAEGDLVDRIRAGLRTAAAAVDSGAAERTLASWVAASRA